MAESINKKVGVENNIAIPKKHKRSLLSKIIVAILFPSLLVGAYFFLLKINYVSGPSIEPFIKGQILLSERITYLFTMPEVGDTVIFKTEDNENSDFVGIISQKEKQTNNPTKYTVLEASRGGILKISKNDIVSKIYSPFISRYEIKKILSYVLLKKQIATIFVMGGNAIGNQKGIYPETASVEFYNSRLNVWERAPSLQTPRSRVATSGIGKKIYVFGGDALSTSYPLDSVEEFDTQVNKWTFKKSMPEARMDAVALSVNGKIYIIGGYEKESKQSSRVDIYNPLSGDWSQGSEMPGSVIVSYNKTCGNIGTIIYCPHAGKNSYTLAYDTISDKWEKLPSENRSSIRSGRGVAIGNQLVTLPWGKNGSNNYLSIYNPADDNFIYDLSYHRMLQDFGVASIGDYFFVIGGYFSSGPESEVYAINTSYPRTWVQLPSLRTARERPAIVTLPILYGSKDEVSIKGKITKNSEPVPNIKVILNTIGEIIGTTYTDDSGAYEFSSLLPGRYRISVENPAHLGEFKSPAYNEQQQVVLEKGSRITDYNYALE